MRNFLFIISFIVILLNDCLAYDDVKPSTFKRLIDGKHQDYFDDTSNKLKIYNAIVTDINIQNSYKATDRNDEIKDTNLTSSLYSSFAFAKYFAINSTLDFDRVKDLPEVGKDRTFDSEGLYVRELNLVFDNKKHGFIFGKFDLNFGKAWNFNRGIVSNELSQNYQQREKIGFGEILRFGDLKKTGRYQLSYSFFKNDRKYLDNAIITTRNNAAKDQATPGDDNIFKSYVIATDIDFDFGKNKKLYYQFSYLNLAVNESQSNLSNLNKIDDQHHYLASMQYIYPLTTDIKMDLMIEYVSVKSFNGNSDISEKYFIANNIVNIFEKYNLIYGYSRRQNIEQNSFGFDDEISEISAGYDFAKSKYFDKLSLQAGYKHQRTNFKSSLETANSLIALIRLQKRF